LHVVSVTRTPSSLPTTAGLETVVADIASPGAAESLLRGSSPNVVVSLAGRASGSMEELCRTNVYAPAALLAAVARHAPKARVILTGSAAEYGHARDVPQPVTETAPCAPVNPYGTTKLAGTVTALGLARDLGLSASVVRPFNIVGAGVPDSLVVGGLIQRILRAAPGDAVKVGRTDTQRDFVAVEDVVAAIKGLMAIQPAPDVYNIASGVPTAIGDLLQSLGAVSGRDVRFETDPALVRPDDVLVSYGSYAKLQALTGFEPRHTLRAALDGAWRAAVAKSSAAP
jgi:NDP-hexose 4-ketoreductase